MPIAPPQIFVSVGAQPLLLEEVITGEMVILRHCMLDARTHVAQHAFDRLAETETDAPEVGSLGPLATPRKSISYTKDKLKPRSSNSKKQIYIGSVPLQFI